MHTIKKILLVSAVFVSGLMIGCTASESAASGLKMFDMEYMDSDLVNWVGDFYLYKDKETGVEYLVFKTTDGVGICPRYKNDIEVYVEK